MLVLDIYFFEFDLDDADKKTLLTHHYFYLRISTLILQNYEIKEHCG